MLAMVSKMSLMLLEVFMSLNIRSMRIPLTTVMVVYKPPELTFMASSSHPMLPMITIIMSKLFQFELKYSEPRPIILKIISTLKTIEKT